MRHLRLDQRVFVIPGETRSKKMGFSFGGFPGATSFDTDAFLKRTVWNKAQVIFGSDPAFWRLDDYGNEIYFDAYGDRSSPFGWEFDHFPVPKVLGGTDYLNNLRPLHWRANAGMGGSLSGLGGLNRSW